MSTVASLPPDIIIHIVTHLPLQDVVSILSTCQELRRLPYTYPLAFHAYFTKMVKVHVLAGILDIPTTPLPVSHPMGAASASFAVDDAVVEEKNEPILSFQKVKERSQSTDWVENYGNISKFITYLVGMTSNSTQLRKTLVAKNTSMSNDEKFLTSVGSGEVELANRCPLGEISLQSNAHVSSTLMKVLSNVPNLTSLNLADTAILDTNVQTLSSLQFLQSLDLSGTSLSLDYIEQNVGREDTRNSGATPSADAHTSAFHVDLRTKSAKSSHALSAITTLTSLDLSRCPFLLSEKLYNLQTLVRLRSLNLSMSGDQCVDVGGKKWKGVHLAALFKTLTALECVNLSNLDHLSMREADRAMKGFQNHPALREVHLQGITVSDDGILSLVSSLSIPLLARSSPPCCLRVVDVSNCNNITESGLKAVCRQTYSTLQQLKASNCSKVALTHELVHSLVLLHQLTSLSLNGLCKIRNPSTGGGDDTKMSTLCSFHDLFFALNRLRLLERLELQGIGKAATPAHGGFAIRDHLVAPPSPQTSIEQGEHKCSFEATKKEGSEHPGFASMYSALDSESVPLRLLWPGCKNLRWLDISGSDFLTDRDLCLFGEKLMPRLGRLDLSYCSNITTDGVKALRVYANTDEQTMSARLWGYLEVDVTECDGIDSADLMSFQSNNLKFQSL